MRLFITGASGHIGGAVIPELLSHGHEVLGLARSDASAAEVEKLGAEVRRGDLDDLEGLQAAARGADGVIHLAFKHEAMLSGDFEGAVASDLTAITAIGDALAGTGKSLVTSSGTLMLAFGGIIGGTEDDALPGGPRVDAENAVIAMAEKDIRSAIVRLPPTVHSSLDHHGFIPALIEFARQKGKAAYVGDGANRWPAGHTLDVAALYRLAVEKAPPGTRLHAVDDNGVPFREIAESIGRHLGVPTVSLATGPEADDYFGFLTMFVQMDNLTSSTKTRELLGWTPTHPNLLADLNQGHYFA